MKSFVEKHCTEEWCKFIDFHKETFFYKKDELIFQAGDEAEGLFIIEKGKVKVTYRQFDGSDRLIRLAKDGDILGHRGFGGSWKYTISAFALEHTELSFIPLDIFNTIAKSNPSFSYNMMLFFAEELRKSEAKIKKYPVVFLVARALFDNYKAFGLEKKSLTKLDYTLSRRDIASKAGTTYETVVRTLAEFKKEGIIKTEGKSIHILEIEKLRELARPQYQKV